MRIQDDQRQHNDKGMVVCKRISSKHREPGDMPGSHFLRSVKPRCCYFVTAVLTLLSTDFITNVSPFCLTVLYVYILT